MASYSTLLKSWGDTGSEYPDGYSYLEGEQPVDAWDNFLIHNVISDLDSLIGTTNARIESDKGASGGEPGSPESSHLYYDEGNEVLEYWNAAVAGWRNIASQNWATGGNISHGQLADAPASAHHSRYSDEEAQDAVGTILDGDFSYDDVGNAISLAATLGVDISGDADTVDGNHASAFADSGHAHALGDLSNVTATGEGSGGGFDADTVDGNHASAFADSGHNHDSRYLNDAADSVGSGHIASNAVGSSQLDGSYPSGSVDATDLSFDPASQTELDSHAGDTTNPHSVTDSQTGAASALNNHAGSDSAHHASGGIAPVPDASSLRVGGYVINTTTDTASINPSESWQTVHSDSLDMSGMVHAWFSGTFTYNVTSGNTTYMYVQLLIDGSTVASDQTNVGSSGTHSLTLTGDYDVMGLGSSTTYEWQTYLSSGSNADDCYVDSRDVQQNATAEKNII